MDVARAAVDAATDQHIAVVGNSTGRRGVRTGIQSDRRTGEMEK